ncbi:MAG: nucleotidyl transferase AbiEii/AbiGii toxin family protein [Bacteroides sp.]|nr:nucleotidyl transferase AbiEii/AbiGii toxin family protein [Bacteroides sp.]
MKLHEDNHQLATAIRITAQELHIPEKFVEKDYWICQILQRLSRLPQASKAVWKGGTSLTKAYGLIKRFSSDVDLAILAEGLSNNQQKNLVLHLGKDSTIDLTETEDFGKAIKNSRFRKTYHSYPSVLYDNNSKLSFLGDYVIVEINTYGNPYPFIELPVKSFITEMMEIRGLTSLIEMMDMQPFTLNVLDKRMTLCEKVVSLLRFSFEEDPLAGLSSKIRHFYDIHFLLQDDDCRKYICGNFPKDLTDLITHDKKEFDRPTLWRATPVIKSPLLEDFENVWRKISPVYRREVGALSYGTLPSDTSISASMKEIIRIIKTNYLL